MKTYIKLSTGPLRYEPTILASPTSNGQDVNIILVPPEPVASDTIILDHRLKITSRRGSLQIFNISRYVSAHFV